MTPKKSKIKIRFNKNNECDARKNSCFVSVLSRQVITQCIALHRGQVVRKSYVELNNDVALLVRLLRVGQALARYALFRARIDYVRYLNLLLTIVECWHLNCRTE